MPMTREEAIEVRKLTYEDYQKSKRHAFQLNADYGRWLIASLLLVHGAAVAFLAQNERLKGTMRFMLHPSQKRFACLRRLPIRSPI